MVFHILNYLKLEFEIGEILIELYKLTVHMLILHYQSGCYHYQIIFVANKRTSDLS